LHDDVQLAGGKLSNHLLHSGAANDVRKPDLESDGEPDLHRNLLVDATRMSNELRPAFPFAVKKSNRSWFCANFPAYSPHC
jgi:hypothetical protein